MQVYSVVLLAGAVLLASAGAASTAKTTSPNLPHLDRSLHGGQDNIAEKRFLRTRTTEVDEDEERAINFKTFPGFEKLSNLFSKDVSLKTLLKWIEKEKPADFVFKRLKLDKAGDKLFDNSDFKVWVAYARALQQKNPDEAIITTLTTRYGEEALSKMILAAKNVDKTKQLATDLQKAQLNKWLLLKMEPRDVHRLLNIKGSATNNVERVLFKNYLKAFNAKYVTR